MRHSLRTAEKAILCGWALAVASVVAMAHCAEPVPDPVEDGGLFEEDAGSFEEDAGATEADGGPAPDGGPRDGGVDAGRADGGPADGGVADGGSVDAGADAGAGTTTVGASKVFETSDLANPSAFDFAAERAIFLSTEANPMLGDFFLFSLEAQTDAGVDNDKLTFVSPRQSTASGGERGVFKATGIEDLSAADAGTIDPATFMAIPSSLVFQEATKNSVHRVPVIAGHVYALQLNFGATPNRYAAIVVDRVVTPVTDGGSQVTKQFVEFRWLFQSQAGRRAFERTFPPRP